MLKNFNHKLFKKYDRLLLAISGGIDSMVMLHNIYELKESMSLDIVVAHVDHNKRDTSKSDREFVEETCKKLNLPFYSKVLEYNKETENFHDYARTLRYEFFYNVSRQNSIKKILLAHNKNDNAETILMRLARGSSLEGYRGILEKTKYREMTILRPMLNVSREEIIKYQEENNIRYREDESNLQDKYTRNRYRHHIFPMIAKENPKYLDKFSQFSEYLDLAYDFIYKEALKYIQSEVKKDKNRYIINTGTFKKLDKIVQIEVAKRVVNIQSDNSIELSYQNLNQIVEAIHNKKPHVELDLAQNLFLYKSYEKVYIQSKKQTFKDYEFVVNGFEKINIFEDGNVTISKKHINNCSNIYILCYNNLDKIFPITIRNRRNGDRIKTSSGTKKVKDLFIDRKVPINQRETLPIILDSKGEILWIPGYYSKETSGENSLCITYQEGKNC